MLKIDKRNRFYSTFNPETGFYMRSGMISEDGKDTGVDPFMASFPELIDVGIMGHCIHGANGLCLQSGVQCYQNGLGMKEPNMALEDFQRIAEECKDKTYQFALGGRGDPDQHENFEEILEICRENSIVPNFTTSGLLFGKQAARLCKERCGAVAVSWYRQVHTYRAIHLLLDEGVKTNIHYVLGNNTIDEAIRRLRNNDFPVGINAVVFLLHKPVGLGKEDNMLRMEDPRVKEFFSLVDSCETDFKIGFDSCSIPAILNLTGNIDHASIDTCEGGRWSMYVTANMKALPCSFDNQTLRWAYDITNDTIQNAWNSPQFEDFRNRFRNACPGCDKRTLCMGGCPICPEIVLCNSEKKEVTA